MRQQIATMTPEAARAMRLSDERLHACLEGMLDCFGIFSSIRDEAGRIVDFRIDYLNRAACSNNRMPLEDQLGRGLCDVLPAHRTTGLFDAYCRVVETGDPVEFNAVAYQDNYGSSSLIARVFEIRAWKLDDGFASAWRDVTEQKATEQALRLNQQALRESEQRLTVAIEAAGLGCYDYDPRTQQTVWSDYLREITGLAGPGGPVSVEAVNAIVHPDDRDHYRRAVEAAIDANGSGRHELEFRIIRPDGTIRFLRDIGRTFYEEHNSLRRAVRVVGIVQDVTERHHAQIARKSVERRMEQLADAMPQLVWTADQQGTVDYYNARTADYSGIVRLETGKWDWRPVVHPDDLKATADRWARCVATGAEYMTEHRIRMADGSYRWHLSRAFRFKAEDGFRWFGTATDIHDLKTVQVRLGESEHRFRLMADGLPALVWVHDAEGNQQFVNRTFAEFFGIDQHELTGSRWQELLHPDDLPGYMQAFIRSVRTRVPFHAMARVRHVTGQWRWIESYGQARISEQDVFIGFVGASLDITERKLAEEQLEITRRELEHANKAKDQFMAALSHELRTPLTPVLMSVQMLERRADLDAEVRSDLAQIRHNVELEVRLIDDLLDLTRITKGKFEIRPSRFDAHELVGRTLQTCRDGLFDEKRLDVQIDLAARDYTLWADPARLEQVLWNLLKNAAKFTPPGGRVCVSTENPAPGLLRISVSDSGIGIEPAQLPRIFNTFEQGGPDVTRRFGGLGLGLTIARMLVEQHGGRVWAHSDGRNRGARFCVDLPTGETPVTRPASSASSPQEHQADRQGARILLVEDHAGTRQVVRRLLEIKGHEVETADSIESALASAERGRFDLVISDLGLPDGSGHQLMRQLRERHGLSGIALSGYGTDDDKARSAAVGFAGHLVKPINIDTLDRAIDSVLKGGPFAGEGDVRDEPDTSAESNAEDRALGDERRSTNAL